MKYALIENGIVVQVQSKKADGFIDVGDCVVCGMIMVDGAFADPQPEVNPRIAEIQAALAEIDAKTIRPLRAGEMDRVAELELQAKALRDELSNLK